MDGIINLALRVRRIIFCNKDSNYYILSTDTDDNKNIICIIQTEKKIEVNNIYNFLGEWVNNPKYGKQFSAMGIVSNYKPNRESFTNFLLSLNIKGFKGKKIEKLVNSLTDDELKELRSNTQIILDKNPKFNLAWYQEICNSLNEYDDLIDIVSALMNYGIKVNFDIAYNLKEKFGNELIPTINNNIFKLINVDSSFTFSKIDAGYIYSGKDPYNKLRIFNFLFYKFKHEVRLGKCYLTEQQIINNIVGYFINYDVNRIIPIANEILNTYYDIFCIININGFNRYYLKYVYEKEVAVKNIIMRMVNSPDNDFSSDVIINTDGLDEKQKDVILSCLKNKISILTGGPGVGKTYTTRAVVDFFKLRGIDFLICAPTGKAAKRSSELTNSTAKTIHRMLKLINIDEEDTTANDTDILSEYSYLIVEESSMLSLDLMYQLLTRIHSHLKILFVGDYDQLPPIEAGTPFKDMVESGIIPTYKLTKIFRQNNKHSLIVEYSHIINKGIPLAPEQMFNEQYFADKTIDFLNIIPTKEKRINTIIDLYIDKINEVRDIKDIQILIPQRKGDYGTLVINELIQKKLLERNITKETGFKFNVNDKVIVIQNNYDIEVFNGDMGIVKEMNDEYVEVLIDDDIKRIDKNYFKILELSYAITIHKSQGSEFDAVILPIFPEHNFMLDKQLIYTGMTRAKKLLVLVGYITTFNQGISTNKMSNKQSSLKEMLFIDYNKNKNININNYVIEYNRN